MHGDGVYIFSNGERYEGWFKMGIRDGYGKYTFYNGNYYEGDWKDGKFLGLRSRTETRKRDLLFLRY